MIGGTAAPVPVIGGTADPPVAVIGGTADPPVAVACSRGLQVTPVK